MIGALRRRCETERPPGFNLAAYSFALYGEGSTLTTTLRRQNGHSLDL